MRKMVEVPADNSEYLAISPLGFIIASYSNVASLQADNIVIARSNMVEK